MEKREEPVEQQPNSRMKLPKLSLPTFDGDLLHWQEFWNILILRSISKIFQMSRSLVI